MDYKRTLDVLRSVHLEAGSPRSNAHAAACSASSILVVKTLIQAPELAPTGTPFESVIAIYGETRLKQLTNKSFKVQPAFFTDWNNWCAQAREKLIKRNS